MSSNHFSKSLIRMGAQIGITVLSLSFVFGAPLSTLAASNSLEVSGWIPYWRVAPGTEDARDHVDQFTEVNPFGYIVKSDGSLSDAMKLSDSSWRSLFKAARKNDVRIVPTIMWSDTNAIQTVLSDPAKRTAHIKAIVSAVNKNDFDGVDIDYEGKNAATRDSYSAFLRELSIALKQGSSPSWLQCTIEARMPLAARFSGTPPANIEYANDLPRINQYCDRVRIMTYDQQTADIQLNNAHSKVPYAPVSDAAWVEKVVGYMDDDISRSKMVIGIATYGTIYQLMPNLNGNGFSYIKLEAFNPQYGNDIADEYDLTPERGPSGELELTYVDKSTSKDLPSQEDLEKLAPKGTKSAYLASAGALAYAKKEHKQTPITFLTWSDAGAIGEKVDLAQKLGVAGVAIFKIDGGSDPDMWDELPDSAPKLLKAPKGNPGDPIVTTPMTPTPSPTPSPTPTTPTTSYTFKTDLEFGMESADIRQLQNKLAAKGYLKATPNGYFGPATKAAVIAWQRANGLPGTGFFGPQSRAKMNGQ